MNPRSTPKRLLCFLFLLLMASVMPLTSGPAEGRNRDLLVQVEFVAMAHKEMTALLFDRKLTADSTSLRKEVQALIEDGKASVAESGIATLKDGRRANLRRSKSSFTPPTATLPRDWLCRTRSNRHQQTRL